MHPSTSLFFAVSSHLNPAFRQWDLYSNATLIVLGLASLFYIVKALRKPGPKPRILWAALASIVGTLVVAVACLLRLPPSP